MPDELVKPEDIIVTLRDGTRFRVSGTVEEQRKQMEKIRELESAEYEQPARVPLPGPMGMGGRTVEIPASKFREGTNIGAEMLGGLASAPAWASGNIPGAMALSGVGVPAARKLVEPIQEAFGVEPRRMGLDEGVLLGVENAALEGVLPPAMSGAAQLLARGPGKLLSLSKMGARRTRELLGMWDQLGMRPPSPAGVLESGWFQGFVGFQEKSLYGNRLWKLRARENEQEALEWTIDLVGRLEP
ncbi:MAG: hypothetical protein NWE76_10885, partial [Candidatus Bathyarchaeota archaeon]|nr:hypothetical protein [Candidatus Bathyarchaeota archaeon]